jgi:hypothetical protein
MGDSRTGGACSCMTTTSLTPSLVVAFGVVVRCAAGMSLRDWGVFLHHRNGYPVCVWIHDLMT